MTGKINLILLALIIGLGGPFYWFFLDASTRGSDVQPVAIEQLRALASTMKGEFPVEVRAASIGIRHVPADLLAAGTGVRPSAYLYQAFQLITPSGKSITIDRGMSRSVAEHEDVSNFDPRAQTVIDQALRKSGLALVLDPSPHHSNRLNAPEELGSGLDSRRYLRQALPYAVAPGVVVIPASSARPGTRMIYVRLQEGAEFLFTGDIAPVATSWERARPPVRIVTSYLRRGNREQIGAWLRTIRALKAAAPQLQIVAGHDASLPRSIKTGFMALPIETRSSAP